MLVTWGKLYNDDFQGLFSPHIIRVMKQKNEMGVVCSTHPTFCQR
jgi:hypothetical protein